MKKRQLALTLLVFALIITATIQPAIAYFTTYVRAEGGYTISIGDTTKIREDYSDWTKHVYISNEENSEPVYIRAKVIYTGSYSLSISGDNWIYDNDDEYYYYSSKYDAETKEYDLIALVGGTETNELTVSIVGIPEKNTEAYAQLRDGEGFSVTVIYESTPVRYNSDGTEYALWDKKIEKYDVTEVGVSG